MKILARSLGSPAVALGCVLWMAAPAARAQEGIFADFSTSLGNFTCQLDFTNSPRAVANFIGLATGQRAWLDVPTGQVRTNAFYDGLTFHRVVAGFMIQGGSRNGLGTDGPGYVFPDQFSPLLRHNAPGVLSMANSGTNSNGAQFFITVANTSWLDNVHTVFGRVVSNMPAVYAISQVATGAGNKPLTNVCTHSVRIRRVGTAAQAFNLDAQSLPLVSQAPLAIIGGGGMVTLRFTNSLNAEVFLRASTNLAVWTSASLGVDLTPPVLTNAQRAAAVPARFHALSRVQYPSSTFAPRTLFNRTLILYANSGVVLVNVFGPDGGGSFTYNGSPGIILGYSWSQGIYRGHLRPIVYDWFYLMPLQLLFTSNSGGVFSGSGYDFSDAYLGDIAGTFTLSAP